MDTFFNKLKNVKEYNSIALIFENENYIDMLRKVIERQCFNQIIVYSSKDEILEDSKDYLETYFYNNGWEQINVKYIKYGYFTGIESSSVIKSDVIFFDRKVNGKTLTKLIEFEPKVILGRIWSTFVSYFDLWETYRIYVDVIYLQVISEEDKVEHLYWENDGNDVELSIIFPVYNVEKYLKQCIESVSFWKAPYIEFIFVIDGSPDNSQKLLEKYQTSDFRIKIIEKENGGCASARKLGQEVALGNYIGFFDPDDFIDPYMYQKLLKRALLGSYDICYCGYNQYFESNQKIVPVDDVIGMPYALGIEQEDEIHRLIMFARVAIWRGIYKANFLKKEKISFYTDLKRFDDLPFKVETFARAKSVITIPEHLYYYRLERPGQDVSCNDERLYVHFDIFKHLDERFGIYKNQKLYDYLQIVKFQTHCYALSKIQEKYQREYAKRMRIDMKINAGLKRTYNLIKQHAGRTNALHYLLIMLHMERIFLLRIRRSEKALSKNEVGTRKILEKLDEIAN